MHIEPIEQEQAPEAARAVFAEVAQNTGAPVGNIWKVLAHNPPVLRAFRAFYTTLWSSPALPPRLKELAHLRVSALNGCAY